LKSLTTPKRTVKHHPSWPLEFADAWFELAGGLADIEDLVEKGYALYPKNKTKDPRKVAADDFERSMAPTRELIPGFNAP
jgi:hypothetical protein